MVGGQGQKRRFIIENVSSAFTKKKKKHARMPTHTCDSPSYKLHVLRIQQCKENRKTSKQPACVVQAARCFVAHLIERRRRRRMFRGIEQNCKLKSALDPPHPPHLPLTCVPMKRGSVSKPRDHRRMTCYASSESVATATRACFGAHHPRVGLPPRYPAPWRAGNFSLPPELQKFYDVAQTPFASSRLREIVLHAYGR